MAEKRTHFGMAGHFAAMSEFLLRGYNVAIPSVDVGDDVFVVDDREGTLRRIQVKTGDSSKIRDERGADGQLAAKSVRYTLSRRQLSEKKVTKLYFMLMVRWEDRWRYLLVPRDDLAELRDQFVSRDRSNKPGPKPKADHAATSDDLGITVRWTVADARGWDSSLQGYLKWSDDFPPITDGPGSTSRAPSPSPDPENGSLPAPRAGSPRDPSEVE